MEENELYEFLKLKAYIEISSYRVKVVKALRNDIITPTQIANKSGIRSNHISKTLGELKKCGVCVCINEEMRKGRLYKLTQLGARLLEVI